MLVLVCECDTGRLPHLCEQSRSMGGRKVIFESMGGRKKITAGARRNLDRVCLVEALDLDRGIDECFWTAH